MNSFNVYGQTEQVVGGNTPVWLGTVRPIPRGAIASKTCNAGMAGVYNAENNTFASVDDPTAAGGTLLGQCNAFAYNDTRSSLDSSMMTCAVVMHHPEGLLIERVYPEITEEQIATLQKNIPGVLLVRG